MAVTSRPVRGSSIQLRAGPWLPKYGVRDVLVPIQVRLPFASWVTRSQEAPRVAEASFRAFEES